MRITHAARDPRSLTGRGSFSHVSTVTSRVILVGMLTNRTGSSHIILMGAVSSKPQGIALMNNVAFISDR